MLSTRRLRHPIATILPLFPSLRLGVADAAYDEGSDSSSEVNVYWGQRPLGGFLKSLLFNVPDVRFIISSTSFGWNCHVHSFTRMAGTILVQARDIGKLNMDIENAIEERRYNDAWKLFEQHLLMEGLPRKSILSKLLTATAESLDVQWLNKCFDLIEYVINEGKENLLEKEPMIYVALCFAKCQFPIPSSTILRKLIEVEQYPPVAAWSAVLAHMSKRANGAYLALELVLEIGYLFQDGRVDPRKKENAPLVSMKPNAVAVNIALAGCLLFGTTRKAEQLLDMMHRIGVKADAALLITMAHIYERNGRREELEKLQRYINEMYNLSERQFEQFYNCLLSCHLKHGDLNSASSMVLKMLRTSKEAQNSLATAAFGFPYGDKSTSGHATPKYLNLRGSLSLESTQSESDSIISYEEFVKDRNFLKIDSEAKEILNALLEKLQMQVPLVTTELGVLMPTETFYVKLVKIFLEAKKTKELVEFLIKMEKQFLPASNDDSTLVHVINLCISLGQLDQAYDILDEMCLAGVRTSASVYSSLLKAYCKENRPREVMALLRDAHKASIQLDSSSYESLIESRVLQKDTQGALKLFKEMKDAKLPRGGHPEFEMVTKERADGNNGKACFMEKLLCEIKEGQEMDSGIHDWNNIIHFFCKKRLMQDAEKALKKMRALGHTPNAQTFHSMVTAYAAVGEKYKEVTDLWGQMKSLASASSMKFDQELLDSVLYTFVRGGFFGRANEVVDIMEKEDMFIDKYKYRALYLKYHRTLYKGKAPKFQTEAQLKKREAALQFKKWIGLN